MRDSARSSAAAAPPSTTTSLVKNEQHGEVSYLDFISLPIIRLDEFDQDELRLLAQYSGDFSEAAFENIVIPKIDRRIFNESAGSRRQTYGKCFASRHWNTGSDNADDSEEEDEDSEPARSRSRGRPRKKRKKERKVNVPDKTRSAKAVARVIVERKERLCLRDTTSQGGAEALGSSSVGIRIQNLVSDSSDVSGWINSAEKTVMPTGTGKRGRPRKLGPNGLPINPPRPDTLADYSSKNQKQEIVSLEVEEDFEEGPGRRTRKRRASANYSVASEAVDGRESKRRPERGIILGRNGETDRKDEGVRTYYGEEELMEILRQMEGKWSSAQMKRKFVDAIGFPKGWTVLVGMRHTNDGRAYFDYREWRSPEGRIWTSYKEAAAYLLSTVGKDICIEGGLGPSLAGQEDGCEQNALIDDGENGVDQTLINSSSFAALLNAHDSQLFFETQAEGDLQSLERGLNQDLQDLERGACEARIDHFQTAGDHVDKFLRASCRSDDVAISTQAFGEQVTIKMEPSTCGAYWEGSRNHLGSQGNLKHRQSDCEVQDLNVSVECGSDAKPQLAQEVDGCKDRRESFDDLLEELDEGEKLKHLKYNDAVRQCVQTASHECGYVCHICGTSFLSSKNLLRHLRRSKHLKFLNCKVCGKRFRSITHLLGHRLKTGHPRVSKEHRGPTSVPTEVSKKVGQSVMSNIVLGLLSDVRPSDPGWKSRESFLLKEPTNRPIDKARGAGKSVPHMLETVGGNVGEAPPSEKPDVVFECQICHKVFNHQSKYWGHLSAHSSKKKGTGAAALKSLIRPKTLQEPDGIYECNICRKVFSHQSKFWGHLSLHSSKRKKAPHSSTLLDPESERLGSRTVEEPEPSIRELDSCSNGVEVSRTACSKEHVTKSVFWKLLNDSLPPDGANREPEQPPDLLPRVQKKRLQTMEAVLASGPLRI